MLTWARNTAWQFYTHSFSRFEATVFLPVHSSTLSFCYHSCLSGAGGNSQECPLLAAIYSATSCNSAVPPGSRPLFGYLPSPSLVCVLGRASSLCSLPFVPKTPSLSPPLSSCKGSVLASFLHKLPVWSCAVLQFEIPPPCYIGVPPPGLSSERCSCLVDLKSPLSKLEL